MSLRLEKIKELAAPLAGQMGLEVLLIEEANERSRRIVRVVLDHPQPGEEVTIEDCTKLSRALSTLLDVEAEIAGAYSLEVSSPGLDRPLVALKHFEAQRGSIIQVQTKVVIGERRKFYGLLCEVKEVAGSESILLEVDGQNYEIPIVEIKKAHLDYFATQEKGSKPKKTKVK